MKKLLFALLLAACTAGKSDVKNTAEQAPVVASKAMPTFTLTKLDGGTFASAELAGKPLMVNFWSPT